MEVPFDRLLAELSVQLASVQQIAALLTEQHQRGLASLPRGCAGHEEALEKAQPPTSQNGKRLSESREGKRLSERKSLKDLPIRVELLQGIVQKEQEEEVRRAERKSLKDMPIRAELLQGIVQKEEERGASSVADESGTSRSNSPEESAITESQSGTSGTPQSGTPKGCSPNSETSLDVDTFGEDSSMSASSPTRAGWQDGGLEPCNRRMDGLRDMEMVDINSDDDGSSVEALLKATATSPEPSENTEDPEFKPVAPEPPLPGTPAAERPDLCEPPALTLETTAAPSDEPTSPKDRRPSNISVSGAAKRAVQARMRVAAQLKEEAAEEEANGSDFEGETKQAADDAAELEEAQDIFPEGDMVTYSAFKSGRASLVMGDSNDEEDEEDLKKACLSVVSQEGLEIDLEDVWKERRKKRTSKRRSGQRSSINARHSLQFNSGGSGGSLEDSSPETSPRLAIKNLAANQPVSWVQKNLITHPNSKWRMLWDMIGASTIFWDLMMIPMQVAFEPPPNIIVRIAAWCTGIFWALDIVRSFFMGFHHKGKVELRLSRIAKRYLKAWFWFDLILVSWDWLLLLAEALVSDKTDHAHYMKMGRAVRFLRMMGLLRLLKVQGILHEFLEAVQSEYIRICVGVCKLLIFIMIVNHFLACGFFWTSTNWSEPAMGWVHHNQLHERSLTYKYMTSLHWSLTQFTPASMEVVPRTWQERVYAVCTVLFALVAFSSFVSSLTGAMTQLRNLNSERLDQGIVLRRYLHENKVDTSLATRIWCWVEHRPNRKRRRTRFENVKLLTNLPRRLQIELHEQVYGSILVGHPFFYFFSISRAQEMRFIYECCSEVPVDMGQEVFAPGQVATHMLFVMSGTLHYTTYDFEGCTPTGAEANQTDGQDGLLPLKDMDYMQSPMKDMDFMQSPRTSEFENMAATESDPNSPGLPESEYDQATNSVTIRYSPGRWLCEPALWFRWQFTGALVASENSELLGLCADRFREVMKNELQEVWEPGKYARLMARFIQRHQIPLSDTWCDMDALECIAAVSFDDIPEKLAAESMSFKNSRTGARHSITSLLTATSTATSSTPGGSQPASRRASNSAPGTRRSSTSSRASSPFRAPGAATPVKPSKKQRDRVPSVWSIGTSETSESSSTGATFSRTNSSLPGSAPLSRAASGIPSGPLSRSTSGIPSAPLSRATSGIPSYSRATSGIPSSVPSRRASANVESSRANSFSSQTGAYAQFNAMAYAGAVPPGQMQPVLPGGPVQHIGPGLMPAQASVAPRRHSMLSPRMAGQIDHDVEAGKPNALEIAQQNMGRRTSMFSAVGKDRPVKARPPALSMDLVGPRPPLKPVASPVPPESSSSSDSDDTPKRTRAAGHGHDSGRRMSLASMFNKK